MSIDEVVGFAAGAVAALWLAGCGGSDGASGQDAGEFTARDGGVGEADPSAAGLFVSAEDLARAKARAESGEEPFASGFSVLAGRADAAVEGDPDPFHMDDIGDIRFGWCGGDDPEGDETLAQATGRFEEDSDRMRSLALMYALTGDSEYGDHAVRYMRAWAEDQTLVNVYDFDIDFEEGTIAGQTEGYCSDRPWNFALDAMWQTYGLINASDAYLLLTRADYPLSGDDDEALSAWLREVAEAVNASFHAWTRWADAHPGSGSYERYRSDNHLSWSLAGLLAAAAALGDEDLAAYVLEGARFEDSRAGAYANPSHVGDVIDRAIEAGSDDDDAGRIYEERIEREPPIGYSLFHLWALALVAQVAEVHYAVDVWTLAGSDGAGLEDAFSRYAAFVLGERASPDPDESTPTGDAWLYELAYRRFEESRFAEAIGAADRGPFIVQSIGPVTLLLGEELP